ncbi:Serine/threonine-protein phosphatase 6 regulatory ankyrin repeat subunit, partial [Globisporangium polare]
MFQCVRIMASLERLRKAHILTGFFRRLATCRSILSRFRDIHAEIDELLRRADVPFSTDPSERDDWRFTIRKQEDGVFDAFKLASRSVDEQQVWNLKAESEAADAARILQYEISFHADMCRPKLMETLTFALNRVLRLIDSEAAALPAWFLSSHDLVFDQTKVRAANAAASRGGQ